MGLTCWSGPFPLTLRSMWTTLSSGLVSGCSKYFIIMKASSLCVASFSSIGGLVTWRSSIARPPPVPPLPHLWLVLSLAQI